MNSKNLFIKIFSVVTLFLCLFTVTSGVEDYSIQEVQKVLKAIETVSSGQLNRDGHILRKVMITESELNSYIAYRIETEREEIMRELRLKLFPDNRIEGKILIDLTGQNIPEFVRPQMTFYLSGKVKAGDGKVKIAVKDLFLESQPIQPVILDFIISIAARIENTESSSINDWYDLPYGIKNIETQKGKAIFYY
ncbi:MAG: hypothetical protein ACOC57_07740 [Acidobacteriota bacterium]